MKKGLPDEILKILEESQLDVIIKMEKFRLSNGTTYDKLKRERLGRTRTTKPNMEKWAPTDIFYRKPKMNFAFNIGNKNIFKPTEKEKNMVYLLTGPFLGANEKNYGIPDGAKSISIVHQGFEFASNNCMSFKPTFEVENPENCYMEYYFKSPDVQIAYWKEKDQAPRVAGVCWWFGKELLNSRKPSNLKKTMKKGLPDEILKILEESQLDVIIKMEKFRLSNGTTYDKLKRERLGRTRTTKPNMEKWAPTDIFYRKPKMNFAFNIGNKNIFKPTEKEKNMVYLLTGPFLGANEKNYGIPDGAKSISIVHQGFEFASNNCMSFKPTFEVENPENCYMEYYFKSPDVQIAYWKEKDQAPRVAGVCWWFGKDSDDQYNLCTIFEVERDQLLEDIYKLRRELKNQAKSGGIAPHNTECLVNCPILKICETMEGEKRVQMRYELAIREKLEENLKEIGEIEAVMDGLVEVVAQKIKGYLPFV